MWGLFEGSTKKKEKNRPRHGDDDRGVDRRRKPLEVAAVMTSEESTPNLLRRVFSVISTQSMLRPHMTGPKNEKEHQERRKESQDDECE